MGMPLDHPKDGGMQVHVAVPIEVIQVKPTGPEFADLGINLLSDKMTDLAIEEVLQSRKHRAPRKLVPMIDQSGRFGRFEGGLATHKGDVDADPKPGIFPCVPYGMVHGVAIHHETGTGQDPLLVSPQNPMVRRMRRTKVIPVNDQSYSFFLLNHTW
jgi:hypothetical protein